MPASAPLTILPGTVCALDNILPSLFNLSGVGASVAVNAPAASPLVLTAHTFSREADGGTYGQLIPVSAPTRPLGVGERGMELRQLERSDFYRTNVGSFEVTRGPVQIVILAEAPQGRSPEARPSSWPATSSPSTTSSVRWASARCTTIGPASA